MAFEIYKVTNLVNRKIYIGQTQDGHLNRFQGHHQAARLDRKTCSLALKRAMQKYGANQFVCELIDSSAQSQEELDRLEIRYIAELNSLTPQGYNITKGGRGVILPPEVCAVLRHSKNRKNKLGYKGIVQRDGGFRAKISWCGQDYTLGTFMTAEDAAKAYDYRALELYGQEASLNFPALKADYLAKRVVVNCRDTRWQRKFEAVPAEPRVSVSVATVKSEYVGVRFVKKTRTWRTKFSYHRYPTAADAALAYDVLAYSKDGKKAQLNYPENIDKYKRNEIVPNSYRNKTHSPYRGVSQSQGKWYAQICVKRKAKCIGYFRTELEAAQAYDKRALELFGDKAKLNFPS